MFLSGVWVVKWFMFLSEVWGSCGSIFSFLWHGWQTFSGSVWLKNLDLWVMIGALLVGFVWLNLQFSVSWYVDFQWDSCGSIFRFLCHGWQIINMVLVSQSLVFCVMVGRLLLGFVWFNLQFWGSWLVDFWCGSFGSIFSFLCHGWQIFSGVRVAQSLVFCVVICRSLVVFNWGTCCSTFSFLCSALQIIVCFLQGYVLLNLQFSVQ